MVSRLRVWVKLEITMNIPFNDILVQLRAMSQYQSGLYGTTLIKPKALLWLLVTIALLNRDWQGCEVNEIQLIFRIHRIVANSSAEFRAAVL